MKRFERDGFTFIEIMTALALVALLVVIAWGKFNKAFEKALHASLVSDLRNLTTAQELYYRLNLSYTTDMGSLKIVPSAKSQIHITEAHNLGWAAWNEIGKSPENCEIYVGKNVTPPLGYAKSSERIYCGQP